MKLTLGGRPIQCAIQERANLAALGYPPPPHFERANSLINPRGEGYARGWFLLLRSDLDQLDLNSLLTLVMEDEWGNSVTVKNLVVAREPTCITPSGSTREPNACFLVEVADSRYRCRNPYYAIPINKSYNVRAAGWGASASPQYYASSLNSGSTWTWSTMLQDIWTTLSPLGTWPGLPSSPDGIPEHYRYLGVSAWEALSQVLDKLGMDVIWQATKGAYTIVSRGATDKSSTSTLSAAADRLIFDRQYASVVRGRVPAKVRVHFHRLQEHRGSEPGTEQDSTQLTTSAVYTVDVSGAAAQTTGSDSASVHALWDDLPALYDPAGTLLNAAALATRAATRASAYYASIQGTGGDRLHQIYSGLVKVDPGSTVSAVLWRQDQDSLTDPDGEAGGLITEVIRVPAIGLRVLDNGQLEEDLADSSALHPPDFRVKEPTYPELLQTVLVTNATPSSGIYAAAVQCYNPDTSAWITRESCGLLPASGETLTTARYLGRLVGYAAGAPLYVTFAQGGGGGGVGSFAPGEIFDPTGGQYTITNAFSDVPNLSFVVPATGTYRVWSQLRLNISGNGAGGVQVRLYDLTAGAYISTSERYPAQFSSTGPSMFADQLVTDVTIHLEWGILSLTNGHTVSLRAITVNSPTAAYVRGDSAGHSTIGYQRLS